MLNDRSWGDLLLWQPSKWEFLVLALCQAPEQRPYRICKASYMKFYDQLQADASEVFIRVYEYTRSLSPLQRGRATEDGQICDMQ